MREKEKKKRSSGKAGEKEIQERPKGEKERKKRERNAVRRINRQSAKIQVRSMGSGQGGG